jgi:hypothetical protein
MMVRGRLQLYGAQDQCAQKSTGPNSSFSAGRRLPSDGRYLTGRIEADARRMDRWVFEEAIAEKGGRPCLPGYLSTRQAHLQ